MTAERLKKNQIQKAKKDFPDLKEKIDTRFAPLLKLDRESGEYLNTLNIQYDRHEAGRKDADYALFTDRIKDLSKNYERSRIHETELKKDIGQLYSGYTKILKDMKEEYIVTVKRESWNENSDYYEPKFASFQRQVSLETYQALNDTDTIAAITVGFTGSRFHSKVGDIWSRLSIKPAERWPGQGHNSAVFFIEEAKELYFHKYILEEDGEKKETDWVKVDGHFYEKNFEYLGMAILTKPYGTFEKDSLVQAAPPGMAYVGNPQYGEWKKNQTGESFWSWYGRYAFFSSFFLTPLYYSSWNNWNRDYKYRKPYFGRTRGGAQKFGTRGTYLKKSPVFQNTSFAKSGGFKTQAASVRGAGSGLRGGGPKRKGK